MSRSSALTSADHAIRCTLKFPNAFLGDVGDSFFYGVKISRSPAFSVRRKRQVDKHGTD